MANCEEGGNCSYTYQPSYRDSICSHPVDSQELGCIRAACRRTTPGPPALRSPGWRTNRTPLDPRVGPLSPPCHPSLLLSISLSHYWINSILLTLAYGLMCTLLQAKAPLTYQITAPALTLVKIMVQSWLKNQPRHKEISQQWNWIAATPQGNTLGRGSLAFQIPA